MAKKKNKQVNTGSQPAVQKQPAAQKTGQQGQETGSFFKRHINLLLPAAIAVVTWLFYQVCINNQFTNWDDPGYIRDNALIKDLSGQGLANIFSTSIMGNYHPLTILTYAIEYSYVRLEPMLYHIDSLLFHILVTILVYFFVKLLTRRPVAAFVAALLFGLHPMHVESVAWLAGRKDVVYGTFYMAACIAYVYYARGAAGKRWKWYGLTLLMFVCSLLGKPVAVVLPMTLLLIDYFEERKLKLALLVEKIPFFLIAIGFGVRSVMDQKNFGSLDTHDVAYKSFERLALGGYALITYLWKAIIPVGLSNFYPYPMKEEGSLSALYYLYPLGVAVLLAGLWLMRKNKVIVFGSLFFLVNMALLLQFLPVGGAIVADRYTYIPYLGLFFMAGWWVSGYFEHGGNLKAGKVVLGIAVAYSLCLGYMSNLRCQVWYDTTSLWRDEIEKEPIKAPNAWNNLGFNYFNKFNDEVKPELKKIYYDSAYFLLNRAIELQPTFVNPYISLGELQRTVGNFPDAKKQYYKAISLKNIFETGNAYLGLAIIYAISHNFDSSAYCFREALQMKPYFPEAQSNFGNFFDMTGKYDSALVHYGIAISQNPDMYAPYLNRGRLLTRLNRIDEAMKDFETALELNPDMGEIYYARSYCYARRKNYPQATRDIEKAITLGFTGVDNRYYQAMKSGTGM